jgi:hypothetical protein
MKKVILIFILCCLFPTLLYAKTFGLVVGINTYKGHASLHGAVNDAKDIARSLKMMGADPVILLLEEEATYDRIKKTWFELANKATAEDTIVFSYAGHGGREPERIPNTEDDHMDDAFILGGFEERGPGTRQRILDNELNQWLLAAKAPSIIMVADSCYSGTMTRAIDTRASAHITYRAIGDYGPLSNDSHPPPSATAAVLVPDDLPNVTFFSSSRENEKTPEVLINNVPRGALSWAFAKALRGDAHSGDSKLTRKTLAGYIIENVQMQAEGKQHPTFSPRGKKDVVLFHIATSQKKNLILPELQVKIIGPGAGSIGSGDLAGVRIITGSAMPDLIWDTRKKQVLSGLGDVVTDYIPTTKRAFLKVVEKWRLLGLIRQLSEQASLILRLGQGNITYHEGQEVAFSIKGNRYPYFTLFNITSDGTPQLVYPLNNDDFKDSLKIPIAHTFPLSLEITKPYGAEHLIAIASADPLTRLHKTLTDTAISSPLILKNILTKLYQGGSYQSGVIGLYSQP